MQGIVSALRTSLPTPVKRFLKYPYLVALDLTDAAERRKDLTPPRHICAVGDGDFKAVGLEFKRIFVNYAGLKPDDHVLDVGCGIGRIAAPLTDYLSENGAYQGFDIVKSGVDWCRKNITARYPNFQFFHSDVRNKNYNPRGVVSAADYKFPFENETFDFVFLTSVFTHMFPADMENYLSEISRVLKVGGRCLITFFLLNDESNFCISLKMGTQSFVHDAGGCYTTTVENPEAAIAFSESTIRESFARRRLSINEPIRYGSWCGRDNYLSYQDIVIAKKR
jgi:ubiquinone/menaquinone biosynthesis C-methylase UbiE